MITREPALGFMGYPGQKIFEGKRLLGTITRTGNYSFYWLAENGRFDNSGKCVSPRSDGTKDNAEEAEQAILRAVGVTQEEFE